MASRLSHSSVNQFEIELKDARKKLLPFPPAAEIIDIVVHMEQILVTVQKSLSKSEIEPLHPIIKALIPKKLLKYPDSGVNISVSCCICEILKITASDPPYDLKQMKEFFESVVMTFEKLSSVTGGCYSKMIKVLEALSSGEILGLMSDLQLNGLIVRLFTQFLTVARSNSSDAVSKMEEFMTMIIKEREELPLELLNLLARSLKNKNQICSQLGKKVLNNCSAQLDLPLPEMMVQTVIPSASGKRKRNNTALKKQAQFVEHGENLVGSRIKVWWPKDKSYYEGIVTSFELGKKKHKVLYDDGDEELLDLKRQKWELVENVSPAQSAAHGKNLVGRKIKVWWPEDDSYYEGIVKSFDCREKKHKVLYDDGDEELLDLKGQKWELVENLSPARSTEHGENLVGSKIGVWWPADKKYYEGVVESFDHSKKKHKVLYDDGDEDVLDLNQRRWMFSEDVSALPDTLGLGLHIEVSSTQSGNASVEGYKVKKSVAPILEAIFQKHGDIASDCVLKTASVREPLLEAICEVVGRIQVNDVTGIISEMEEIESHLSDAEASKINVSWLRPHLEAIYKMAKANEKCRSLMEMKASTSLVTRAAEKSDRDADRASDCTRMV